MDPGLAKTRGCDGNGFEDVVRCVDCTSSCPKGQYLSYESCIGQGTSNVVKCMSMTCEATQYLSGASRDGLETASIDVAVGRTHYFKFSRMSPL